MPTSRAPLHAPKNAKASISRGKVGANPGHGVATHSKSAIVVVTARLPNRLIIHPAAGCATRAPSAIKSSAIPSVPSLKPSRCLTSGIRATQLATTAPFIKKIVATASRAARGRSNVIPSTRSPASIMWPCVLLCARRATLPRELCHGLEDQPNTCFLVPHRGIEDQVEGLYGVPVATIVLLDIGGTASIFVTHTPLGVGPADAIASHHALNASRERGY